MKKIFAMLLAVVLVVAMAVPVHAVTPALKAPKIPVIPEVKVTVKVTVTDGFWQRWFAEHSIR